MLDLLSQLTKYPAVAPAVVSDAMVVGVFPGFNRKYKPTAITVRAIIPPIFSSLFLLLEGVRFAFSGLLYWLDNRRSIIQLIFHIFIGDKRRAFVNDVRSNWNECMLERNN